jgi:hypothetical protein
MGLFTERAGRPAAGAAAGGVIAPFPWSPAVDPRVFRAIAEEATVPEWGAARRMGEEAVLPVAERFLEAVSTGDINEVKACMALNSRLDAPEIGRLEGRQVRLYWAGFFASIKGFSAKNRFDRFGGDQVTASWSRSYLFIPTGRRVTLSGETTLTFEVGRIVAQTDHFDLRLWMHQIFGAKAFALMLLPGWSDWIRGEMRKQLSV